MARILLIFSFFVCTTSGFAQQSLSVEKIMRDPRWIGSSPSNPRWTQDGTMLYFNWNPEKDISDSLYFIALPGKNPMKATPDMYRSLTSKGNFQYNEARTAYLYTQDGDLFIHELRGKRTRRITQTVETESAPHFSFRDSKVVYIRDQNLYAWDIQSGETQQLTNLRGDSQGTASKASSTTGSKTGNTTQQAQEEWLKNDQLRYFEVLRTRKVKREKANAYLKSVPEPRELRRIDMQDKRLAGLSISPDGRFVSYSLTRPAANAKNSIVPNYVTETGFTTDIPSRPKVGAPQQVQEFYIYDRDRDSIWMLRADSLPGIEDLPDYTKDYPAKTYEKNKKSPVRTVRVQQIQWSPDGRHAVMDIRSDDNKDRWLVRWDTASAGLRLLDRQRDEAWIAGPGISFGRMGWLSKDLLWFQSERTGYSHLYTVDVVSGAQSAITAGHFEVQQAQLSRDKKYFYIVSNEVHPGEQHFYRLTVATGKKERITTMAGANQVTISPDEKMLAVLHSSPTRPWELYLVENKPGGKTDQITDKGRSEEFKSYPWREPEIVTFKARDGAIVYARLYKPANPHPNKPAVLFVHGAGYLQNAHKWWSSYFREYMFNNLLADLGYHVLDIDYRGSAGYGRDWRTGIYRHMGGKDLSDHVDAVDYLVRHHGVNPRHVGLYGGSYGGFISLMGMFTEPEVFAAGAALRPVTDWAQYNHGYTSNILNEPYRDSIAYRRSSPLYFAEGLKGHLLICHGMIDVNVHFQDAVKLVQRLIELGKENWELAVYPLEDHGFVEPVSWTDEYKRILKLFEEVLKK